MNLPIENHHNHHQDSFELNNHHFLKNFLIIQETRNYLVD